MVINFKLPLIVKLPNFPQVFDNLSQLTKSVIDISSVTQDECFAECLDTLLDAWVALVSFLGQLQVDFKIANPSATINTSSHLMAIEQLKNISGDLFQHFVRSNLRFGKPNLQAEEENDDTQSFYQVSFI